MPHKNRKWYLHVQFPACLVCGKPLMRYHPVVAPEMIEKAKILGPIDYNLPALGARLPKAAMP